MLQGLVRVLRSRTTTTERSNPFNSLPDDLLEELFYVFLQDPIHSSSPWPLSHVNRRWRAVAISSPRLWSDLGSIQIDITLSTEKEASLLNRVETQLQRAAQHHISFKFDPGWSLLTRLFPAGIRILTLLVKHSSQWRDVKLIIHPGVEDALEGIGGRLQLLRSLSLTLQGYTEPSPLPHFAVAPQLRSVAFIASWASIRADDIDNLKLPWSQLDHYRESCTPGVFGVKQALLNAPGLSSLDCRIRGPTPVSPSFHLDTALKKEALTTLHLRLDSSDASALLHRLILPALVDLSILAIDVYTLFTDMEALISNSACSLLSLKVMGEANAWNTTDPSEVLKACPELLALSINHLTPEVYARMGAGTAGSMSSGVTLLPKLRSLTLSLSAFYASPLADYEAFSRLAGLRDRMYSEGTAEKLDLVLETHQFPSHVSLAILAMLESWPTVPDAQFAQVARWHRSLQRQTFTTTPSRWRFLKPKYHGGILLMASVFDEMEDYPTDPANLIALYLMNIPALLQRVAATHSAHIPANSLRGFSKRARKILEQWKPALLQDIKKNRRWGRRWVDISDQRLYYIHKEGAEERDVWNIVISG